MKKQAQKMTKEEKQLAEQKAYLMGLAPVETLKKFTKKRAEKIAEIIARDRITEGVYFWMSSETLFARLVCATKCGVELADRFIAIADFMVAQGIRSTKDLWGKSEHQADRGYLTVLIKLAELSLSSWAKNARVIVYNQSFGPVVKAYKYSRVSKELWVTFGEEGMITAISLGSSKIFPDKSLPDFEWVAISEQSQKVAISDLLSGCQVQLPRV